MNKISLISVAFLISSCFGVKHGGSSGRAKILEEFFIGDGKMQYFVKPLYFQGLNQSLIVDFTFRDSSGIKSKVNLNFSIISASKILKVDSIAVMDAIGRYRFSISAPKLMFHEVNGNEVTSRFSSSFEYDAFSSLILQEERIVVFCSDKSIFLPTSKTKKRSKKLARFFA